MRSIIFFNAPEVSGATREFIFFCVKIQVEKELNAFKYLIPQAWQSIHPAVSSHDLFPSYHPVAPLKVINRGTNELGRVETNSPKVSSLFPFISQIKCP